MHRFSRMGNQLETDSSINVDVRSSCELVPSKPQLGHQ
jgi:hypothetical protein